MRIYEYMRMKKNNCVLNIGNMNYFLEDLKLKGYKKTLEILIKRPSGLD